MGRYINIDALLAQLEGEEAPFPYTEEDRCYVNGYEFAKSIVMTQPTVDAEPVKHGKWIWNDNAIDWGIGAWVCSKCHGRNANIAANKSVNPYAWAGSQFCPNCGAKMDKEG